MTPKNNRARLLYYIKFSVHHFKSIIEIKLDLQSGNAQFGSKSIISWAMWLWNLTYELEKQFYAISSFVHHLVANGEFKLEMPNLGPNWWFFWLCDLAIWHMTLKNNRAQPLCYFKLCSHWVIQTGVTVQARPIWVKIDDFFSRVTLQFDVWPSKRIGHLFYAISRFVHQFVAIGEFKLK